MIESARPAPSSYARAPDSSTVYLVLSMLLFGVGLFVTLWWGGQVTWFRYVYPVAALAAALLLYYTFPLYYFGLVWWVVFLSPFIRRVIDLQAGWADPNPVLLAPYLVTWVAGITLVKHIRRYRERAILPYVVALVAILIGYLVGVVRVSPFAATFSLLQWVGPVLLGFHVYLEWPNYPEYRRLTQRIFIWGAIIMGTYGILQFFFLPAWDVFWMENADMASVGRAKPLGVRVFSTLNAPAPFAYVMLPGMLLIFNGRRLVDLAAAAPGYVGFMLSLVRAGWGGWLVGLFYMMLRSSGSARTRLLTIFVVGGLLVLPLLATDVILDTVGGRVATIGSLEDDGSLQARLSAYRGVTLRILNDPIGYGMGASGSAQRTSTGTAPVLDSGLLDIGLQLGWLGAFLYLWALARLLWPLLNNRKLNQDSFAVAAVGIALAMIALLLFGKTQIGSGGSVLWVFLSLAAAASRHQQHLTEHLTE